MMQSINTDFRLSANHADKQLMLNMFWQKSRNTQINIVKTAKIVFELLVHQNTVFSRLIDCLVVIFRIPMKTLEKKFLNVKSVENMDKLKKNV